MIEKLYNPEIDTRSREKPEEKLIFISMVIALLVLSCDNRVMYSRVPDDTKASKDEEIREMSIPPNESITPLPLPLHEIQNIPPQKSFKEKPLKLTPEQKWENTRRKRPVRLAELKLNSEDLNHRKKVLVAPQQHVPPPMAAASITDLPTSQPTPEPTMTPWPTETAAPTETATEQP